MTAIDGHINAYKPADEPVTNAGTGAVLHDDDSLLFAVGANETWFWRIHAYYTTASGVPDIKVAMNGPATNNIMYCTTIHEHTGAVGSVSDIKAAWEATLSINYPAAADDITIIEGTCETTAAGIVVFRWAQNVASADATTVKRGSTLLAVRMG